MKEATLVLVFQDDQVLLAMKKRGFGVGKWNGTGGKIEPGETSTQAAIRESQEEIGITPELTKSDAEITFTFLDGFELRVHVFRAERFSGTPTESEEMRPQWFPLPDIPYTNMWDDDRYWLPLLIAKKKFTAHFWFDEQKKVMKHEIHEM